MKTDIGMEFGVKKCSVLKLKRGKIVKCDGIILPDVQAMKQMKTGTGTWEYWNVIKSWERK